MIASTLAITALVAGGVLAWRAVRGGDEGGLGRADDWDRLALVDNGSGDVVVLDGDGESEGDVEGAGQVSAVYAHGKRLVLVTDEQITITDGSDDEPNTVAIDAAERVRPIWTVDRLALVIGTPTGGNVRIVDVETGDLIDVGAMAEQTDPLVFADTVRVAADGRTFAVADAANFQTIVVGFDQPEASFYPDQPIAVGDQLIATSQVVGRQADIALYDRERRNQALVPTEIPAGGVMDGDRLVVVSIDGSVLRIARGDDEAERIGEVTVPAGERINWAHPTAGGERLVVAGPVSLAVVDLDGASVFATTFPSSVPLTPPRPAWSCLPVGGADSYHSLIVLDDGRQIADLSGLTVTGWASDGCTVIGDRDGSIEVVGADGTITLGDVNGATLGPDGRSVVYLTSDRRVELVRITGDDELVLGEPVDLTARAPRSYLAAFLDR